MEFRSSAIVLKKEDIGESDRSYLFYTRDFGKVRSIARGVRKSRAKLSASLENFNSSSVIIMKTKGMGNIKSVFIEQNRRALRGSYECLSESFFVADFFDRNIGWEEKDPDLFILLEEFFEQLNIFAQTGKQAKSSFLRDVFFYKMLSHLGHALALDHCVVCSGSISSDDQTLDVRKGGTVCFRCKNRGRAQSVWLLTKETMKFFRLISRYSLPSLAKIVLQEKENRLFHSVLGEYKEHIFT